MTPRPVWRQTRPLLGDLASLADEIALQKVEVSRYSRGASWGAVSLVQRESSREDLVRLEGEQAQALARRQGLLVDLAESELVSPLDGLVLEIHAREGERPGSDGVMDIGASQRMQARIEVYESDIAQINLDQQVQLTSENGGFTSAQRSRHPDQSTGATARCAVHRSHR